MRVKRIIGTQSLILVLMLSAMVSSCSLTKWITRTEKDTYTVTHRDTTVIERVRNVPGTTKDTSHVAPNSRTVEYLPHPYTADSVEVRDYPNFLRLGLFEVAGIYAGGSGPGGGLLGAYQIGNDNSDFLNKSEMIRIAPLEIRLRWFNDAPNWTFGTSVFEHWAMDDAPHHNTSYGTSSEHSFASYVGMNQYVRRRFYIRDEIPYVIVQPFLGISEFPSAYVNLGGELHVGSLGGLNLRAYAGLISGFDWAFPSVGGTFPYFAVGVSALDYTNRLEETMREWKDYTRTTINTCLVDLSLGSSKWGQAHFASVQFPLPFGNYHVWLGTSMMDYLQFDTSRTALGILPISAGYRQYLGSDWMLEPYVEASYYPSTFANAALRIKALAGASFSIGGVVGFAAGSPGAFGSATNSSFSGPYFGVTIFAGDWNFTPERIRDLRAHEIPSTLK